MLFNSLDFKALESSLNAQYLKQEIINQNLANLDTPGYKAKELSFENMLENAMSDEDIKSGKTDYSFGVKITESDATSIRVDGNNVDSDEQSLELYSSYIQSAYLIEKVNAVISNYRYVLNQTSFK